MTGTTAAAALRYLPPKGVITAEVKAALITAFGEDDVVTLAASTPFDILPRIETALPGNEVDWLDIATAMIEALGRMGHGTAKAAASASTQTPQHIVVETAKKIYELNTRELLTRLAAGEGDVAELLTALQSKADVIKAVSRTDGKIAILTDGKIDPQATDDYIQRLNRTYGKAERMVDGKAPTTLNRALNRSQMVTLNPITEEIEYVGTCNAYGFVISDVDDELYQAVAWAKMTDHGFFPAHTRDQVELTRHHQELLTPDGVRARRILEDYRSAKEETGDANILIAIPRQMTEEQATQLAADHVGPTAPRYTPQRTPAPREVNWEEVVRRHFDKIDELSSTSRRVNGQGNRVTGQFTSLTVGGQGHRLTDVVVIDRLTISGQGHVGNVTMPPRRAADESGVGHNVRVTNVTWEEIARLIGARP